MRIMMNRPELSNAFNEELISEIINVFTTADGVTNKAILLAGSGKQFSAGMKSYRNGSTTVCRPLCLNPLFTHSITFHSPDQPNRR